MDLGDLSIAPSAPIVRMEGIWKRFGPTVANAGASFVARRGQVHALLGENGAGKSTLMGILSGLHRPDAGRMDVDGHPVEFGSPAQAMTRGIGLVHQHFQLVDDLTVAENIHLGWRETPLITSRRAMRDRTVAIATETGLEVDPTAHVWQLSTGERQRVEILRVLARGVNVLVLDEPTAVLTPIEADVLFQVIERLRAQDRAIVFISHKLDEVFRIADHVTVMRGGRTVASMPLAEAERGELAHLAVGETEVLSMPRGLPLSRDEILRVDGAVAASDRGHEALHGVSLVVHAYEVLGIAGVAGNGQSELAEVVTGLRHARAGSVLLAGIELRDLGAREVANAGVGHIPEDRLGAGLIADLSVLDNAILRQYHRPPLARGPILDAARAKTLAVELIRAGGVRTAGLEQPVGSLSGGNQQRLVVRRELSASIRLIVAVHPTRGLDISATNDVRTALMRFRNAGGAVLLISEDLDELILMSDRILTMSRGRIMGESVSGSVDRRAIGRQMAGLPA
jgi:simple sugar transport system ATP-binding protein